MVIREVNVFKKNIAIFAHYDKENIIDDYVLIYLRNLKKFCQKIVFVSDGSLSKEEQQKISHLVSDVIAEKHGEYDFGSWKRGFNLLKEKYPQEFLNADNLIFVNDSCYCLGDFDLIFGQINLMPEIDCFGITDSEKYGYHLQSYFLVLKKTVFLEKFFDSFLNNVKKQGLKIDVIKDYEVGLSALLKENDKKLYAIFGRSPLQKYVNQNKKLIKKRIFKIIGWRQKLFGIRRIHRTFFKPFEMYCYSNAFYILILAGCPLIKKSIPLKCNNINLFKAAFNTSSIFFFWHKIISQETRFNPRIIHNYNSRFAAKIK